MTPVGPRDGWQPGDEFACGVLNDGRTVVTVPRPPSGDRQAGTPETGPVRLWDLETGVLRASHFGPSDVFNWFMVDPGTGLLRIQQPAGEPHTFLLRLLDPLTARETARFTCRVPKDNVWWQFSGDGRTTAYITYDGEAASTVIHDVTTARRLRVVPDGREVIRLSHDGRRLAVRRGNAIVVVDVPTGAEVTTLAHGASKATWTSARMFSPDGRLLLDTAGGVWDVDAGRLRFQVPGPFGQSSVFTADGSAVVGLDLADSACHLAYYDVRDGRELADRRVRVFAVNAPAGASYPWPAGTSYPWLELGVWPSDNPLAVVRGVTRTEPPSTIGRWLAKVPGLDGLGRESGVREFVVFELSSGREVTRGEGDLWCATPDGRFVVTRNEGGRYAAWDVPPGRPYRWLIPAWLAWTIAFVAVAGVFARRRRRRHRVRGDNSCVIPTNDKLGQAADPLGPPR